MSQSDEKLTRRAETIPGAQKALAEAATMARHMIGLGEAVVIEVRKDARRRTNDQNSKLWPMLNDVSKQVRWHGQMLSPDDWKDIFTAALKGQRSAPGIHGGVVMFGARTSKMNTKQLAELIEFIYWFGAENNVAWSEKEPDER